MKFKSKLRYVCSFIIGVLVLTSVWLFNDYIIVRSEAYPSNAYWSLIILILTLLLLFAFVFWLLPSKKTSRKLIEVGAVLLFSTAASAILLLCFGDTLHALLSTHIFNGLSV